jgi:hypothetical protein
METLSKFGVPLGGGSGRGGILQPKYKYRFRVRFVNFGPLTTGLDLTQQVVSIERPKITYEAAEVHSYNSRAYFAGKHQWGDIQLVVRDDVTNAVSRLVGHQVQKQMNHLEQTAFMAGVNYKFTTIIETMDGGNDGVLETWTLEGCFLTDIGYDTLEYTDTNGFLTITMTLKYDNATMSDGLFTETPSFLPGLKLG